MAPIITPQRKVASVLNNPLRMAFLRFYETNTTASRGVIIDS
jgi:hypothetical protein